MEKEAPRILIVDDDLDFASLLTDVFSQASYDVEMTGDPTKVEELIRSMDFSLVVTDLRMPGLNGFELAKKIKAIKTELPIIMVSGFLESKDREKMESEGIVGLYEKPLSVFSLLKNAAKLIAEGKSKTKKASSETVEKPGDANDLGFPFKALPCQSDASHAFAESIYRMRNRRQNLCIVTPRGTPTRAIAEDFFSWLNPETADSRIIEPNDFSLELLEQIAREAGEKKLESFVISIPETERLDPGQQKQLARGSRKGTFSDHWEGHFRFIFMIGSDVETLYQEGVLSDELYLSMGGSELHVPLLSDCPDDIEAAARAAETEDGDSLSWDADAINLLRGRDWPGNFTELRKVLFRLQQNYSGRPLSARDVLEAMNEDESAVSPKARSENISLFETLDACRSSYLLALSDLVDGDTAVIASIAEVPQEFVEKVLSN